MTYPRMMCIKQEFSTPKLSDVIGTTNDEFDKLQLTGRISQGDSVAITIGGRGISNIDLIIKTVVGKLRELGAEPFLVPAMGSQGGGTADGQRAIIEGYNVTERFCNAPIKSTMDVVQVGITEERFPIYFDRYAYEADHVVVINRIKPHTLFSGEIESGLHKMMLIGLGNHAGANICHQAIVNQSFDAIIRSVSQIIIKNCNILFGIGIVENQNHETALIRAVAPKEFMKSEIKMLTLAKNWMPRLPFQQTDLLIVDQIGKNISGHGMDTNIIGRKYHEHHSSDGEYPKITRIYVRDLTEESHGNATGIGLAEYAHTRLVKKIDHETTNINCMVASHPSAAAIPIHYNTDKKVLNAALTTIGYIKPADAKVIRIRNTLDLQEVLVSEAYLEEVENRKDMHIVGIIKEMQFNEKGDLLPF